MRTRAEGVRTDRTRRKPNPPTALVITWPWWLHPAWALLLIAGSMALLSIATPSEAYAVWKVPKYLGTTEALLLAINVIAMTAGILLASGAAARGGTARITINARQRTWLLTAYRVMFVLTLMGYAIWTSSAVAQGVSIADLLSVVERSVGAIGDLKSNLRPIGGATTLTQLGPLVVTLGYLLYKLGAVRPWFFVVVALAGLRYLFYAERLALIEVVVPLVVTIALTTSPGSRRARLARIGPLVATPLLWLVFAVSEYNRSWVFYEATTQTPFAEWVTLRLVGYYTTSYNNSALLLHALDGTYALPYYSVTALWNAPGLEQLLPPPNVMGMSPRDWWDMTLARYANPEFTNSGSFLMTTAEFGVLGSTAYWLVTGVLLGALFGAMTRGSLPGLLATVTVFVGILELPRIAYWSLGRATPFILALVLISLFYPRGRRDRSGRVP